jgi:hypothetical protein
MRNALAALSADASVGNASTVPTIAFRRLLFPSKVDFLADPFREAGSDIPSHRPFF